MKKSKLKDLVNAKRKLVEKEIKGDLIIRLKEVAGTFDLDSKKITKKVNKVARKLSKELAVSVKLRKSDVLKEFKERKAPSEVITPDQSHASADAPVKVSQVRQKAGRPAVVSNPEVKAPAASARRRAAKASIVHSEENKDSLPQ